MKWPTSSPKAREKLVFLLVWGCFGWGGGGQWDGELRWVDGWMGGCGPASLKRGQSVEVRLGGRKKCRRAAPWTHPTNVQRQVTMAMAEMDWNMVYRMLFFFWGGAKACECRVFG